MPFSYKISDMKKILICAAAALETAAYVETLPKGNEDIRPEKTEESAGGSGLRAAEILRGFRQEYSLLAHSGSGIYGEHLRKLAEEAGIELREPVFETSGCVVRLIDRQGKQSFFLVPGGEFSFNPDEAEYEDSRDLKAAYLTCDYLAGDDGEDVLQMMSYLDCPVYFCPSLRLDETDEEILESLWSLSPVWISEGGDILKVTGEKDIRTAMKALHSKTGREVLALLGSDGLLCYDGDDFFRTETDGELKKADSISAEETAVSFMAARSMGIDLRNSTVFARESAERFTHKNHHPGEYDFAALRQRLVEMITHG